MDYEKKYKEALERARQFSEKPYLEDSKGIVDYIFPELKESEGERIKEALIHLVNSNKELSFGIDNYDNIKWSDILAWLEKQKHGEVAIEGQVRDHNFIDFDSSGTSFMIPVPNHNLKCGDKVLVKILKLE